MSTSTTAKNRLLSKIEIWINENELNAKVCVQMNVIHARKIREEIASLSEEDAIKTENSIEEAEYYDPMKDRFGFGPKTISPLDIPAFFP